MNRPEEPSERHVEPEAREEPQTGLVRVPEQSLALPGVSPELIQKAQELLEDVHAASTKRSYELGWESFKAWCRGASLPFLPADAPTVVLYLTHLAYEVIPKRGRRTGQQGCSLATVQIARAAISWGHQTAGVENPTKHPRVTGLLKGLQRRAAEAPLRARPLMPELLAAVVRKLAVRRPAKRESVRFLRERALLLTGFAGALRARELVGLQRQDVRLMKGGLHFDLVRQQGKVIHETVAGTKHHGAAEGQHVDFERDARLTKLGVCPVQALRAWLAVAGELREGSHLFHDRGEPVSFQRLERLVKQGAEAVGLDPTKYSGHSLRAGMATWLIWEKGWNTFAVRDYLRHRKVETLNVYVRDWDEVPEERT